MKTAVFRKANFNSAHRLNNPLFDEKTNDELFGLCNNPNYHGHNYDLIVKVVGEVDPVTGYVFDMKILNDIIKEEVIERFDHKNLNLRYSRI
jgi:6-pyruvoyltetrahydropterin/6-carboxytetrahydropterin synthase